MSFIGRKPRCRDLFLCENARKKYQDYIFTKVKNKTNLFFIFMYVIQHCFICRPSDSAVSEDAGIEARTVATFALTARRSNHSARSHPQNLPMRKQGIYLISPSFMPLLHRFHPGNLILKLRAKDPLVFHCQISP